MRVIECGINDTMGSGDLYDKEDGRIWYYDGVNYFAVPAGYTLDEDGQARDEDGKLFTGDWSGERYDPAAVWGQNWVNDNWGGSG